MRTTPRVGEATGVSPVNTFLYTKAKNLETNLVSSQCYFYPAGRPGAWDPEELLQEFFLQRSWGRIEIEEVTSSLLH